MSDEPISEEVLEEFSELRLSRVRDLWEDSWSTLARGLMVSALLHLLVAMPIWCAPPIPRDMDVEWEGRFASLAGIGHGSEEFDDEEEVDWDEMEDLHAYVEEEFFEEEEVVEEEEPEEEP